MPRTQNTNINVDLIGSLIPFEVVCRVYGDSNPDLNNDDVRRAFFAFWASLHEDMATAIRDERVSRDAKKAARRKAHAELVGDLERRLAAFNKALVAYPELNTRHSQARIVCDEVRKLANQFAIEAKKESKS